MVHDISGWNELSKGGKFHLSKKLRLNKFLKNLSHLMRKTKPREERRSRIADRESNSRPASATRVYSANRQAKVGSHVERKLGRRSLKAVKSVDVVPPIESGPMLKPHGSYISLDTCYSSRPSTVSEGPISWDSSPCDGLRLTRALKRKALSATELRPCPMSPMEQPNQRQSVNLPTGYSFSEGQSYCEEPTGRDELVAAVREPRQARCDSSNVRSLSTTSQFSYRPGPPSPPVCPRVNRSQTQSKDRRDPSVRLTARYIFKKDDVGQTRKQAPASLSPFAVNAGPDFKVYERFDNGEWPTPLTDKEPLTSKPVKWMERDRMRQIEQIKRDICVGKGVQPLLFGFYSVKKSVSPTNVSCDPKRFKTYVKPNRVEFITRPKEDAERAIQMNHAKTPITSRKSENVIGSYNFERARRVCATNDVIYSSKSVHGIGPNKSGGLVNPIQCRQVNGPNKSELLIGSNNINYNSQLSIGPKVPELHTRICTCSNCMANWQEPAARPPLAPPLPPRCPRIMSQRELDMYTRRLQRQMCR